MSQKFGRSVVGSEVLRLKGVKLKLFLPVAAMPANQGKTDQDKEVENRSKSDV